MYTTALYIHEKANGRDYVNCGICSLPCYEYVNVKFMMVSLAFRVEMGKKISKSGLDIEILICEIFVFLVFYVASFPFVDRDYTYAAMFLDVPAACQRWYQEFPKALIELVCLHSRQDNDRHSLKRQPGDLTDSPTFNSWTTLRSYLSL